MKKEQKSQESIYNNKGGSALLRVLHFILPYCIYTKLPLSLKKDSPTPKTKTSWWTKLTEKKENFKDKNMCNINISWTIAPLLRLFDFIRYYSHDPIKRIKYYRHKISGNDIFSDKIITIELVKKENSGLNKQIKITDIIFCLQGVDKFGDEFLEDYQIDWIDKKYLTFKENDDIQEYKIKIPKKICFDYFDSQELFLTIAYATPLDTNFKLSTRQIDLKSEIIIAPFTEFTTKTNKINEILNKLDKQNDFKRTLQTKIKNDNDFWNQRDEE